MNINIIQNLIIYIYVNTIIIIIKFLLDSKKFLLSEKKLLKIYGKNSWIVITGGSSGQGKQYAIKFAEKGFNIIL